MDRKTTRSVLLNPLFLGTLIGFGAAAYILPGGFDSFTRLMRPMPDFVPTPAWVYLLTTPLGWLGWPHSWMAFVVITILVAALAQMALFGERARWWVGVFNTAMLWNLWLGNQEIFALAGLILGWKVLEKKLHPAWWGVGAVFLVSKPQVGFGLFVLFTIWLWKERGFRRLVPAGAAAVGLVLLTMLVWPGWLPRWIYNSVYLDLGTAWYNGAAFPWGLAAWAPALLPVAMPRLRRSRLVTIATLLSSPYLVLYHSVLLMAQYRHPAALVVSWAVVGFGLLMPGNWMQWAWLLPAALLAAEAAAMLREQSAFSRLDSVEPRIKPG